MSNGKNFIDFILAAQGDDQLALDFINTDSPEDLQKLFVSKDYTIDLNDCEKLIKAKEKLTPEAVGGVKY